VSGFNGYIQLVYVLVAAMFVMGLHLMNSPATARRGNQVAQAGMVIAVVATLILLIHSGTVTATGWVVVIVGSLLGSAVGLWAARTVQMTAMPQLVSAFNAVGGGAAALVAVYGYYEAESRVTGRAGHRHQRPDPGGRGDRARRPGRPPGRGRPAATSRGRRRCRRHC